MSVAEQVAALTAARRRLLAVGLLLVLVFGAWAGILSPLARIVASQDDWRAAARRELARNRGQESVGGAVESQLRSLPGAPVWARFYGESGGADVLSHVQRDITELCAGVGIPVPVVMALPTTESNGISRYGVRLTANMTVDQLRKLAEALRTHSTFLRTERLSITAPQIQSAEQNSVFAVSMEVFGYSHRQPARSVS